MRVRYMMRLILMFLIVLEFLLTNPSMLFALKHASETCLDQERPSAFQNTKVFLSLSAKPMVSHRDGRRSQGVCTSEWYALLCTFCYWMTFSSCLPKTQACSNPNECLKNFIARVDDLEYFGVSYKFRMVRKLWLLSMEEALTMHKAIIRQQIEKHML